MIPTATYRISDLIAFFVEEGDAYNADRFTAIAENGIERVSGETLLSMFDRFACNKIAACVVGHLEAASHWPSRAERMEHGVECHCTACMIGE